MSTASALRGRWGAIAVLLVALCDARARAAGPPRGPAELELAQRRQAFEQVRGARAVVPLLGAAALDDHLLDGGKALGAFLAEAAARTDEPLVQAQARLEYARWLDRHEGGDHDAVRAPLALIEGASVFVVGPFVNDAGAALAADSKLAPEQGKDNLLRGALPVGTSWPSGIGDRRAELRVMPAGGRGVLALGAVLRPETHLAAYVVFSVESPRAQAAVLRIGTSGAYVAWLNGERIGSHTDDRALALDADASSAPLIAGLNRFVVRVAVGDRQPEALVRLTDARGNALAGVRTVPAVDARAGVTARAMHPRAALRSLRSLLDAEAKRDPRVALDRDAYVLRSGIDGPTPAALCARLAAIAASPPDHARTDLLLACADDAEARRRVVEARLEVAPATLRDERILRLTQLGELALRGRLQQRGEDWLRQAVALGTPLESWRARLRLAELDADRGLPTLARDKLAALVAVAPSRRVREAVAQLDQRNGRRAAALAAYVALATQLPGDVALLRQVAAMERGRGTQADLESARRRLAASAVELRDREGIDVERAELESGLGNDARAVELLTSLLAIAPDDARIEERLGRLLDSQGKREEALRHLNLALRLKPQSPELAALLGDIDPARRSSGDLARRFSVDLKALRARAAKDPLGKEDPARVLYDATTVRVHDNGLEETFTERIIEIGDRRGAEREGEVDIRYSPDAQTVEVLVARIYKANGEIVDAATIEERDLSEPGYGLYYDVRAQAVGLQGLEQGDVIHVAYTVSDHGRRNELGESFGDLRMLQEEMVRLETSYRLIAPKRRTIYFNEPRLAPKGDKVAPSITDVGAEREYVYVARDVAKIRPEANMPGATALGAYVHASTFASWSDVARFYRTLVAPQLEPSAEIRRAARDAIKGKTTIEDKVAAIYDLVLKSTRYVGLEFGVHGYQPYKVSQVWERGFGDCKDKASLLVSMLKEVGIDASLVLLRTRREGAVDPSPASLAPFDHAIAYVPALDRYLDGTAEFSGATELPSEDQGVSVLRVTEGRLHSTPVDAPDAARMDTDLDVRLGADGSATARDRRTVRGQVAEAWRRHYQAPAQRKERFEKVWAQRSPGAQVDRMELPHLAERERPIELDAQLRLPRLARRDGASTLALPLLAREPQLLSTFARLSSRTHALEISQAFLEREHVRVVLPPGAQARVPEGRRVDSRFGRFKLDAEVRDGVVEVRAETLVAVRTVAVGDYAEFRAFLAELDRAVAGEIYVELAGAK